MGIYKNPRIAVTCPQDTYDTYKEYSELINLPLSKVVVNILEESEPMIKMIIQAVKDSKGDKEKFIETMQKTLVVKSADALQQSINFKDSL